jgi:hypothetical protein
MPSLWPYASGAPANSVTVAEGMSIFLIVPADLSET